MLEPEPLSKTGREPEVGTKRHGLLGGASAAAASTIVSARGDAIGLILAALLAGTSPLIALRSFVPPPQLSAAV